MDKKMTFAIVGASSNTEKWGHKIYVKMRDSGFKVFAVNPKKELIAGDESFESLKKLPKKPDVVITVVPPAITEKVVETCIKMGIRKVWMQPGSESAEAIKKCENAGIVLIYNACFVADGMKEKF